MGEKFANFAVILPSAKVFSRKFLCREFTAWPFLIGNPRNFSPRNAIFSPIRESFHPRKVSGLYGTLRRHPSHQVLLAGGATLEVSVQGPHEAVVPGNTKQPLLFESQRQTEVL